MSHWARASVSITTTAGGAATHYLTVKSTRPSGVTVSPSDAVRFWGVFLTNVDMTGTGTITITGETSASPFMAATVTVLDGTVKPIHVQAESSADATTNLGTNENQPLIEERLKIVVAGGGITKTGTLNVLFQSGDPIEVTQATI